MRILSIGNFGHGWDGSICDEEHIAGALEELGHEVVRQQREERIYDHHGVKFDFMLISQWDGYAPDLLGRMKQQDGCPIVYWSFDWQDQNQDWHNRLIEGSDLYLSKRIADSKYPNWQWLAQDFAPKFLDKWDASIDDSHYELDGRKKVIEKDIDVLFTGSWLDWASERIATLQAVDAKFNLVVHTVNPQDWPQTFKDVRGPIMDDGLPELYARAKVILSIDHTLEAGYWSDRNAQIICCDERPLFRYIPLSELRFHEDVDYFYSIEDCLNKIQERLSDTLGIHKTPDIRRYKVKYRVQDLLTIVGSIL